MDVRAHPKHRAGRGMHLTNNSLSYIMERMYPGADDMTLREFYGGDMTRVWLSVAFSLMIFGASLYQLNMRLKKI